MQGEHMPVDIRAGGTGVTPLLAVAMKRCSWLDGVDRCSCFVSARLVHCLQELQQEGYMHADTCHAFMACLGNHAFEMNSIENSGQLLL